VSRVPGVVRDECIPRLVHGEAAQREQRGGAQGEPHDPPTVAAPGRAVRPAPVASMNDGLDYLQAAMDFAVTGAPLSGVKVTTTGRFLPLHLMDS
jgi:hypothetical protein